MDVQVDKMKQFGPTRERVILVRLAGGGCCLKTNEIIEITRGCQ
jgi:hypothetical protein